MTGSPRTQDWTPWDRCRICSARRSAPCWNMNRGQIHGHAARPHSERRLILDRNPHGAMLLGRREHTTWSRPGTTHGAHAHHAVADGVAVCSGALIAVDTLRPLVLLGPAERCKRRPCKRLYTEEEEQW